MEWSKYYYKFWAAAAILISALLGFSGGTQAQMNDKWLTVVLSGEPNHLDGCHSSGAAQGHVLKQNIVETLIERDPADFSLKPRLATAWRQIDDSTWRIELRRGVTFHDGAPMDAAAVKWSLERTATQKELDCRDNSRSFTGLKFEFTALDPYTLQIKSSQPTPILPMMLTNVAIVAPSTIRDKLSLAPVGTGPFVFVSWQSGQQILMKRNEQYWGAKPQVEGVRFIWRGESSVRAAMVAIGEADIAVNIGQADATDPELDHSFLNSNTLALRIDTATPPLNDRRVRLAMDYAVDRAAVMNSIMPKGTLYATQLVVPAIPGHNHDLDKSRRPYDPAKARQLLAEAKAAGVPTDKEILLIGYPQSFPNANELMEAFHGMFQAVGFNVKIQNTEAGQYAMWNHKPYPDPRPPYVIQSLHDNLSGDPVFTVPNKYACEASSSAFCDPEFDKEAVAASALTGEKRAAAWSRLFQVLYEEVPDIVLFHMVGFTRVSKRIDFTPDVTTGSEIRFQEITFK